MRQDGSCNPTACHRQRDVMSRTADATWPAVAVTVAAVALLVQTRINPLLMLLVGGILGELGFL